MVLDLVAFQMWSNALKISTYPHKPYLLLPKKKKQTKKQIKK